MADVRAQVSRLVVYIQRDKATSDTCGPRVVQLP